MVGHIIVNRCKRYIESIKIVRVMCIFTRSIRVCKYMLAQLL